MKKKVLDTSAILRSNLDFSDGCYVITDNVIHEIKDEIIKSVIDSGIRNGRIEIKTPDDDFLKRVKEEAEKTGDLNRLSDTDIELIAIALENDYTIVTDDYSIQNMCKCLKIDYEKNIHDGIKRKLKWSMICEGCGREYDYKTNISKCEICGSYLRKRAEFIE